MRHIFFLLLMLVTIPVAARGDRQRVDLEGQVITTSGARSSSLRLLCNPDSDGGAISVELWVPQAFKRKDFDYDDFEGPDAVAGNRPLSHVSLTGAAGTTEMPSVAAGWYSGEDPDTFVFGLSQRSHEPGAIATFLNAIDSKHVQLVWVQNGYDDPKHELRATFPLDPATIKRIRDAVGVCLVPAAKSTPGAKN